MSIRVLVWNEGRHEKRNPKVAEIYPRGIHNAIGDHLKKFPEFDVITATQDDDPEHGCGEERLSRTDVLLWWGHMAHEEVADPIVERLHRHVLDGMGAVILHSGHFSKLFQRLMGTTGNLKWRDKGEREIVWVTRPGHPIVQGIDDHFIIPVEEMYGEYFDIPEPMETVLISSFEGGEVFRSGCTWQRGQGRIFYFRPGHELFPTYYDRNVLRIIENAIRWAAPTRSAKGVTFGKRERDGRTTMSRGSGEKTTHGG